MVIGIIARIVFRHRKTLYKILTAQDRAIGSAWKRGGYGRQTRYGVRTGAAAGTLTAPFITNFAPDTPGNELQTPFQKRIKTYTPYKTRSRFSTRYSSRSSFGQRPNKFGRCPSPRKQYRS